MQAHARVSRVQLQIKGGGLDCLLFLPRQARQAVSERVGDAEVHHIGLIVGGCFIMQSVDAEMS